MEGIHAVEVKRMVFVYESSRDRDLNDRVQREGVHTPGRQEGLRRQITAQDRRRTGTLHGAKGAVDGDLSPVLSQPVSHTAYYTRSLYRIGARPCWGSDLRRRR